MGSREILDTLIKNGYDEFDTELLMEIAFSIYRDKKRNIKWYNSDSFIPQNLIKLYYSKDNHQSDFKNIISNFKKKYIEQESKMENVHNVEEIEGLGIVYDYIRSDDWTKCPNIYCIYLLNLKLFSLTPYPEAGGKLRNADCYIKGSKINTCPYPQIDKEISKLYLEFDRLIKQGLQLKKNKSVDNEDKIIEYINDCLKLKCHLIEIHPFQDGNGRTMRAMVNLLFKLAGVPPVYVKLSDRSKYLSAMNVAIENKDYNYINRFYYYKICDSIFELDVNYRIKKNINKKIRIKK